MRRRAVLGAAVATVLSLAACGGLPQTGPVTDGRRLGDNVGDPVRVFAQGPVDGSSQEAIVRGFIRAGDDSDETRATGKSYLAPQSIDLWRPTSMDIVVYDSVADIAVKKVGEESLEVTTDAVAKVTPDGRYEELPAGTQVKATFGLTKVGGEWRVVLPATGFGLWLDSNAFDRLFTNRVGFYVTPAGRRLVPDPRWFPSGSRMATTLSRAQLSPVPDYLAGALVTGVPVGTKLAVNAVPVENGVAQVNLSTQALEADPDDRTAMWAQLTATLGQVAGVSSVSLSAEGAPLDLPGGGNAVSSASALGFDIVVPTSFDTALLRQKDKLAVIDPRYIPDDVNGKRPPPSTKTSFTASIPEGWTRLALSADGREIAAVGGDLKELSRWQATKAPILVPSFATGLTRPTYDASGFLWVGGVDPAGNARVFVLDSDTADAGAVPAAISVPWLRSRRVVSLTVAADGARMLIVTTNTAGADAQLAVTGIVRSANGAPTALAAPWRQAQPLTLIKDVVWLDSTTYAVLGRIADTEPVRAWLGTIGAGVDGIRRRGNADPKDSRLAAVPRGASITTVGGPRGLIVITDEGSVLARAGATWRKINEGTDLLVPGR